MTMMQRLTGSNRAVNTQDQPQSEHSCGVNRVNRVNRGRRAYAHTNMCVTYVKDTDQRKKSLACVNTPLLTLLTLLNPHTDSLSG